MVVLRAQNHRELDSAKPRLLEG